MSKVFKNEELGLEVEIGKYATQADGSAFIKHGNNVVLSTVVATKEPRDFMGFFPLTVEYRERTSAAGRFPGGFIKREGRLSDFEILASRLIDRPVRPLFPKFYFNEVQLLSTVYSSDSLYPTDVLALIGSSFALALSPIPFNGPLGAVRVGRINGEWRFNLGYEENKESDVAITITGTEGGISMVEGHSNGISEEELITVLEQAHEIIKKQVTWQKQVAAELGIVKDEVQYTRDWDMLKEKVATALPNDLAEQLYTNKKGERGVVMRRLRKELAESFKDDMATGVITKAELGFLFDTRLKEVLPDHIAKVKKRVDGRAFDEVRSITTEVGVLPMVHGSSMFRRGETQTLVSVTLGTASDAQKMEPLHGGLIEKNFMLHYNFPPFSTGEVRMMRGVGRREIGHGYLAETSFKNVLPSKEDFPYTVRSIADVLESNGSSSMASVCGTTMALMDAGVPISGMVSGIAMGLMQDSSGGYHVISDILGLEDALGLMDFKITGNENGIMAVQMDIKATGLTHDIMSRALDQARVGRQYILDEMRKVMDAPRSEPSELAPRITVIKVAVDKIGAIIGPAGKNIKEVIATHGVEVDIEDDGSVNVYSKDAQATEAAIAHIRILAGEIEIGSKFKGTVVRHADFGFFVDIIPGKGGLVHVSSIDRDKQRDIEKICPIGSTIDVKVTNFDRETGRIRLVAPSIEGESRGSRDDR